MISLLSMRQISKTFGASQASLDFRSSYDIAPTQKILVINNDGRRQIVYCIWGFVLSWAKDLSIGNPMINAWVETVASLM